MSFIDHNMQMKDEEDTVTIRIERPDGDLYFDNAKITFTENSAHNIIGEYKQQLGRCKRMKAFEDALVGDEVWSNIYGDGKITGVGANTAMYPITVFFEGVNVRETFDYDGKISRYSAYPSLFWERYLGFIPVQKKRPKTLQETDWHKVKAGTPVFVKQNESEGVFKRYNFAMFLPNAKLSFFVFDDAYDFENSTSLEQFKYCKLAKPVAQTNKLLKNTIGDIGKCSIGD